MKLNSGKIIKIVAVILGIIGLGIAITYIYLNTIARYSISLNSSSYYLRMRIILLILIYVFSIVSVCTLIFGIGHIIVLLQKMNVNLLNLNKCKEGTDIPQSDQSFQANASISPEIPHISNEHMWKRPVSDDN